MIEELLLKKAAGEPIYEIKKPFMRFLRFIVGGQEFLVDLPLVMEISEPKDIYPVPGSSYFILGLMNLRGNIMTIYDIRMIFNINAVWKSEHSSILVLSFHNENIGLFVDNVLDIVNIYKEEDIFEDDEFISGYGIVLGNRKLSILDVEFIINKT